MTTPTANRHAVRVGLNIRFARQNVGLTGNDVLRRTGIHPTTLSFLELGKQEASQLQLRLLAGCFRVPIAALLAGEIETIPAPSRRRRAA